MASRDRIWPFVLPSLVLTGALFGVPVLSALYLSLTDLALRGQAPRFVGLANYLALAGDERLLAASGNTVLFALAGAVAQTVLGLVCALGLDALRRGARTLLPAIMIPNIITPVAGALFLKWLFASRFGLADAILIPLGFSTPDWLGDPVWARALIVAGDTWRAAPFAALVLYAALQTRDRAVDEAARIDGARFPQLVRYVIVPDLRPVLLVVFGLRLMDGIRLFDLVYVLTDGGPGSATETISFYAYTLAMRRLEIGRAAAVCVVAAALAMAPLLVVWGASRVWRR